jgi:DNA-binding transcriptional MerR regulator
MKNFLSIKEFSKLSGIESSTLRYWDEIGLFAPIKRDPENDYRYYSPEQIIAVNFIKVLSGLNVPLKVIGEAGKSRTPESIIRLIGQQEKALDAEMRRLQESYAVMHARREMINYGRRVINGDLVDVDKVSVVRRESMNIVLGPRNEFKKGEGFYEPFMYFCRQAKDLRVNLNFPIGAVHENWEGFVGAPGEPNYFCSVDPSGNDKQASGEYVVGFTRGYYGQFGDLPQRMAKYIEEEGLVVSGLVYVLYLHDEVCIRDPSKYLVQVCVAVAK